MSKTFKIIAAVLALVMLAGCTVFSVITWSTVRALAQEREQEEEFTCPAATPASVTRTGRRWRWPPPCWRRSSPTA